MGAPFSRTSATVNANTGTLKHRAQLITGHVAAQQVESIFRLLMGTTATAVALLSFDLAHAADAPPPLSPLASLRSIQVRDGFTVELVAAEPLVMDPISLDWGSDGRLWVVEMADYPLGMDGKGKPGGRVRFLEDTDHDGKYDKSTLFLDGLSYPSSVMVWREGILVSMCARHLLR